ncbi:hypothetical protein RDV64_12975 [Acuticoccus sp. MNP-M23]|nr:hypothetical protein [Acuticoccus sp. MNP-M23]WMS45164.1 hypothetical protein RDV64_12975 [Acuticoccus sp. MNP-M23]
MIQHVAQPAQHALARNTLRDVQDVFYDVIKNDQAKKNQTQCDEVRDLIQIHPKDLLGKVLPGNRVIDDPLGQFQSHVQNRERHNRHHHDEDLLAPRITPDKFEK